MEKGDGSHGPQGPVALKIDRYILYIKMYLINSQYSAPFRVKSVLIILVRGWIKYKPISLLTPLK